MASNAIAKALQDLQKAVLPLVKGYLLQEGAQMLSIYYQRYLQADSKPRKSKSGRRYYAEANDTDRLRTLYGNIQRALLPDGRNTGNITEILVDKNEVILSSGIDTDAKVKAGNKVTTLAYAAIHEAEDRGKSTSRRRPFLEPGLADFNREEMPEILQDIANELSRFYSGR